MAVSLAHLTAGAEEDTKTVFTTASTTPGASTICLLGVFAQGGSFTGSTVPTISGNGRTWNLIRQQVYLDAFATAGAYIWLFEGVGTPSAGTVTITFPTNAGICGWVHDELSSSNASPIVQSAGNQSDSNGSTVTLAAFTSATNGTYGFHLLNGSADTVVGSGFTELVDHGAFSLRFQSQWRADADTSVTWTWAGGDRQWAAIAVELNETVGGGGRTVLNTRSHPLGIRAGMGWRVQ
jgi:hypothetical protein